MTDDQAQNEPDQPSTAGPAPAGAAPPPTDATYDAPPPTDSADDAPPPTHATPPPAEPPEPQRRIWDPGTGRWVTPGEITAHHAAPQAAHPAAPTPTAAPPPRPAYAQPLRAPQPGVPSWAVALVAGACGAVLGVVAMLFVPGPVQRRPDLASPTAKPDGSGGALDTSELARGARPWVVGVNVVAKRDGVLGSTRVERNGSGVIMRADGVIATPARLVEDASTVSVILPSGKQLDAQVSGADPVTDVAVLKIGGIDLVPAVPASTEALDLGDLVVSVSAINGISTVVTVGSIAAVGRTVRPDEGSLLLDLLQIDAPLAAGGSGGVLVGAGNAAIGMAASFGETSGATGYAIPIDVVRSVTDQIVAGGKIAHPWIGASTDDGGDERGGLIVTAVVEDGPAERAGLRRGDIVTAIDGRAVQGPLTLLKAMVEAKVGAELRLTVARDPSSEEIVVDVIDRPKLG